VLNFFPCFSVLLQAMDRNQEIIRTSVVGIVANVLLAAFKAAVGVLAGSIAIIMDAVNNLSDALSSVITILGTKLSERPADRMHPFGHGRVEYFSAIVIAIIVLAAGLSSLVESVKKLFNPTEPDYTTFTLVVIVVAITVKLVLGRYVKAKGQKLRSDSLIASGADALFDAVITLSTLISAIIMLLWQVSVDGYLGTIISLVIIKSGVGMLRSPINELLGSRVSCDLVREIKAEVMSFDGVYGVFDLILHTYGPDTMIGSLHVNVLDSTTASQIHSLERNISMRLFEKFGIIATVGIYAINTGGTAASRMQHDIMKRVFEVPGIESAHGFFVDFSRNIITFDIIPTYDSRDDNALRASLVSSLQQDYPDFHFSVVIDHNYSEE
jgi:cation diffusion facilitator family transporter